MTAAPSGAPVSALPGAGATEWGGLFITHRSVPALYHAMHVCYLLTTNGVPCRRAATDRLCRDPLSECRARTRHPGTDTLARLESETADWRL